MAADLHFSNVGGCCQHVVMDEATGPIAQATAVLADVVRLQIATLTDGELCDSVSRLEAAGRLLDAARVRVAAEVEDRSRIELGTGGLAYRYGQRRGAHLVEQLARVSQAEAVRRVRLGTAVRDRVSLLGEPLPPAYPLLATALVAGSVGVDAAAAITRNLDLASQRHANAQDLAAAEEALVDAATTDTAECVAVQAIAWRDALDPDGAEPREEAIRERRGVWVSRERNGITTVRAQCDASLASLFKAAFSDGTNPDSQPRFLSDEDRDRGTTMVETATGELVEKFVDPRSREQLQHDILTGLLTAGLRSTGLAPGEMRSLARVNIVITKEDFDTGHGVGWVDDLDEPISAATVQQYACDAELRQVILGPNGEILELGKAQRLFTAAQRIALAVRDGGCVWTGCTAPPGWCHAHHVDAWKADDGPTDINNGALLCPAHHHMLHHTGFRMRMHNGRPQLQAPPWLDPQQHWHTVGGSRANQTRQLARGGAA